MNKKQLIALATVTTLVAGAATIYLLTKKKREKRLAVVSNAGYEMAYDVHYPIRYKKRS
jgi:Flp pilus assembly protein protease CpaA